jgi:hypothetical protein
VAWECGGEFELMTHCHCSMCRKSHGAAFGTYVGAPAAGFRWLGGEKEIVRYESSPGFHRPFCARCGSVVAGDPGGDRVFMPAGCLDGDPAVRPLAHIFAASKAPWYEIRDDLRRFDAYPPGFDAAEVKRPAEPEQEEDRIRGSCLCGAVTYQLEGRLSLMVNCHCSRCRKARSAAHATNLFAHSDALRWLRGEDLVHRFKLPGAERFTNCFCQVCSSILPRVDQARGLAIVPAGTLDGDPGARERFHIFTGSKAPWYEISDDLPRFEESAPRDRFAPDGGLAKP